MSNKKILIVFGICLMLMLPSQMILAKGSHSSSHSSSRSSSFRSSSSYKSSSKSTTKAKTPTKASIAKTKSDTTKTKVYNVNKAKATAKETATKAKAKAYKTATKTKAAAYKTKVKKETKARNYTNYTTYRTTHINNNYRHPTYKTYFSPGYYSFNSSNCFWSNYWLYQAMSQHSMYPVNNVVTGSPATYSRWHDVFTVIVVIGIGYVIYRIVRRRY
ncbi:hypothetical protein [Clostridium lacusfryxellense]|uniref:hypothetical protein n=1 Tax=Clostridium lacusfryxellense TaxID=205328 RepID=UPI001C0C8269|nr:hypothetical protein [Clostridium lacusfryxellense]MBU3111979.1 hypothetical protein [Clostridium lacusfryxellense]